VVLVVLLGGMALPVSAGISGDAAFTIDCTGFTGTSGQITLNRDNTGTGREAFIVSATDGAGNVIYKPIEDSFFVGGTVSWVGTGLVRWNAAPQYNPITLRVVSRSGKGFNEQTILQTTGACADLPGFGVVPVGTFIISTDPLLTLKLNLDGITSPSVGLNAVPPRPTNPPELVNVLEGFAIVNTDNLSLRTGDGPEYALVGIVDGGTRLAVLGRNQKFTWWYVQAGNIVGWAKAEFLIMRGDLTGAKVIEAKGELTPPSLFIFKTQPIFAERSDTALPLCSIPGQLEYLIVGRDKQINWYEIQATCGDVLVKGWIKADLGATRNPANVPIPVTSGQ
jgi:hypothetical protein